MTGTVGRTSSMVDPLGIGVNQVVSTRKLNNRDRNPTRNRKNLVNWSPVLGPARRKPNSYSSWVLTRPDEPMSSDVSVTRLIGMLKAGDRLASQQLWEVYFGRLVGLRALVSRTRYAVRRMRKTWP